MLRDVLVIGIIFIAMFLILHYTKDKKEAFLSGADRLHADFIEQSKQKYTPVSNLINLVKPSVNVNQNSIGAALNTLVANPSGTSYMLQPTAPVKLPTKLPPNIEMAKKCEAVPNTCDSFNDPTFAANCGMSFDIKGTASDGTPHVGGLYIGINDRVDQEMDATSVRQNSSAPYDPYKVYQPTIGTASRGTFGITKDGCRIVKEKVDCESKQTFGSPNCAQCYTSRRFSRVEPCHRDG